VTCGAPGKKSRKVKSTFCLIKMRQGRERRKGGEGENQRKTAFKLKNKLTPRSLQGTESKRGKKGRSKAGGKGLTDLLEKEKKSRKR